MRTVTVLPLVSLLALLACSHHLPPARAHATAAKGEPTTEEGCSSCGGEWAAHGLLGAQHGTMSCLCPTPDAGKRCRDGVECQGECVTDGADHEVTAAGPPALGFFVGKCSRFRTTYGCHRAIASGALHAGPVPLDQPPTEICAD